MPAACHFLPVSPTAWAWERQVSGLWPLRWMAGPVLGAGVGFGFLWTWTSYPVCAPVAAGSRVLVFLALWRLTFPGCVGSSRGSLPLSLVVGAWLLPRHAASVLLHFAGIVRCPRCWDWHGLVAVPSPALNYAV